MREGCFEEHTNSLANLLFRVMGSVGLGSVVAVGVRRHASLPMISNVFPEGLR